MVIKVRQKKYNVEITFIDVDDNIINSENTKFEIETKKAAPTGKIEVKTDKYFKKAKIKFNTKNEDEVLIDKYTYYVYDGFNNVISSNEFNNKSYKSISSFTKRSLLLNFLLVNVRQLARKLSKGTSSLTYLFLNLISIMTDLNESVFIIFKL